MDDIDKHAQQHGYHIEDAVRGGNPGYRLIGGRRVFGERVRIFCAAPDRRSRPKVRRELYEEAKRRLANFHGRVDKSSQLNDRKRVEVAKAYELLEKNKREADLVEVVQFYLKHKPKEKECTIKAAVLQFLETRGVTADEFANTDRGYRREKDRRQRRFGGYSRAHRFTLTSQMRKFCQDFGDEQIGIMPAKRTDLKAWLDRNFSNKTTRSNYRRALHNFFSWAVEEGFLAENPAKPWKTSRTSDDRAKEFAFPGILSPQELREYLQGAHTHSKRLLSYFALGAFSGIRTDEFEELRWGSIRPADNIIFATSAVSKTGEPRTVPIHPTLAAWLEILPRGRADERVVPTIFEAMRRRLLKELNRKRKTKLKWPPNALRHSFGSYRYRQTLSLEKTSDEMRHSDPKLFRKHYLNPDVTDAMAKEYWSLTPSKVLALEPPPKPKDKKKPTPKPRKKAAKRRKR
jgi:site-specific recombinase XerD